MKRSRTITYLNLTLILISLPLISELLLQFFPHKLITSYYAWMKDLNNILVMPLKIAFLNQLNFANNKAFLIILSFIFYVFIIYALSIFLDKQKEKKENTKNPYNFIIWEQIHSKNDLY